MFFKVKKIKDGILDLVTIFGSALRNTSVESRRGQKVEGRLLSFIMKPIQMKMMLVQEKNILKLAQAKKILNGGLNASYR